MPDLLKLDCHYHKTPKYKTPPNVNRPRHQRRYIDLKQCNFKKWLKANGFSPRGVSQWWTYSALKTARDTGGVRFKAYLSGGKVYYKHHQKDLVNYLYWRHSEAGDNNFARELQDKRVVKMLERLKSKQQ